MCLGGLGHDGAKCAKTLQQFEEYAQCGCDYGEGAREGEASGISESSTAPHLAGRALLVHETRNDLQERGFTRAAGAEDLRIGTPE